MNRLLFPVALIGTLTIAGVALTAWTWVALVPYLALVALASVALVRRARAAQRPAGSTCSCCTSTVYDPVEVR